MITIHKNQIDVQTKTLTAQIRNGVITSLVSRLDGRQYIQQPAPPVALELVHLGGDISPLGGQPGDSISNHRINDLQAEVRVHGWFGDGVIAVSEDTAGGDLVVEPAGYTSRPGLRACRWTIGGIAEGLQLVAPFWQGVHLELEDGLIRNTFWNWPQNWEAGLAILAGEGGGLWMHCRDDRYRYKNLQVGTAGDARKLGFEAEAYGPLEDNLSAGGIAWRINVYKGDWRRPAGQYRDWLEKAYGLRQSWRPEWTKDLRLAISWCPCDIALLDALKRRLDPKTVLLHVPNWRSDGYDENYPTYQAGRKGKAFIAAARKLGFRTMPHMNAIDMDPSHEAYAYIRDFQYRDAAHRKVQGWTWYQGGPRPVPESNAARTRHRDKKTMVKVHPGLSMWRSILTQNVHQAVEALGLDVVFLDVSMNTWNLKQCLVEAMTPTEGMKRLLAQVGAIGGHLAVAGEGRNEIVMQDECLAQVHLFKSSGHKNIEGLERTGKTALCEFLFGRWCRSFGYSALNGQSEVEELRMKLHVDLGAIPTLTLRGAKEISRPNAAVEALLKLAGS
jgi:hypothetical protein